MGRGVQITQDIVRGALAVDGPSLAGERTRTHDGLPTVTVDESGPDTGRADHHRPLRTLEDLHGLRPRGGSAATTAIDGLWHTGT